MLSLAERLSRLREGDKETDFAYEAAGWREALPLLLPFLQAPLGMDRIERGEAILKRYLLDLFQNGMTGEEARFLAAWSKELGFLLKFKPYGVKCATPLGYAMFFLKPGMGFSYQRHRTRKTELFHILKPLDRAQVYLSSSEEWESVYETASFNRWLSGEKNDRYEAYATRPQPGEVFVITELDTVHTVLGCILEEYATVSTDLVDRLHDQNTGRNDDLSVPREEVNLWLASLPAVHPATRRTQKDRTPVPLRPETKDGFTCLVLADSEAFKAEQFEIEAGSRATVQAEPGKARSLFARNGAVQIELRECEEAAETFAPPLSLAAGETILVPPGIDLTFVAAEKAILSCHTIEPEKALK